MRQFPAFLPHNKLIGYWVEQLHQMYHALALLTVAMLLGTAKQALPWLTAAGWCFIAGVVLFSGSLYLISLAGIKAVGPVTPMGGVALIVGWACLAIAAFRWT